MRFTKAHAYGNDFLYVRDADVGAGRRARRAGARAVRAAHRHRRRRPDRLRADAGRRVDAAVQRRRQPGGGVGQRRPRPGGAAAARRRPRRTSTITIQTEGGRQAAGRGPGASGSRQTFRAAMGLPADLRQVTVTAAGESVAARGHELRQPAVRRARPAARRGAVRPARAGARASRDVSRRAPTSSSRTSRRPTRVRILIWERGVGPTTSSGTGSCASLVAAAAFGGAARDADGHRAGRAAARRVARRQRLSDRLGRGRLSKGTGSGRLLRVLGATSARSDFFDDAQCAPAAAGGGRRRRDRASIAAANAPERRARPSIAAR